MASNQLVTLANVPQLAPNQVVRLRWIPGQLAVPSLKSRFLPKQTVRSEHYNGNWVFYYDDGTKVAFKSPYGSDQAYVYVEYNNANNLVMKMEYTPFDLTQIPGKEGLSLLDTLLGRALAELGSDGSAKDEFTDVSEWVGECRVLIRRYQTEATPTFKAHMRIFKQLLQKLTEKDIKARYSPSTLFTLHLDRVYNETAEQGRMGVLNQVDDFFRAVLLTISTFYPRNRWTVTESMRLNVMFESEEISWLGALRYLTPVMNMKDICVPLQFKITHWQALMSTMAFFETLQGNGVVIVPNGNVPIVPTFVDNNETFFTNSPPSM